MDGGTAERVYAQLKTAVLSGAISMHARIEFAEIADDFGVSTTPVREAAMRLWGEGLLAAHERGGLRALLASEDRLRALLDLNQTLLASALTHAIPGSSDQADDDSAVSIEARTRALFRAIARQTNNSAFVDVIERLSDQLAIYRHREPEVIGDVIAELDRLGRSALNLGAFRTALRLYHRRRRTRAAQLVWAASAPRSVDL